LLGRMPSAVGYQPTLATDMGALQERITTTKKGSITSVQAIYVPADDLTDPAPATTFAHLDATIVLARSIAELGICMDRMRHRWAQAQAFRNYRLARRVRGMDIEYEIARLLGDFVLQLYIKFQSDHKRPLTRGERPSGGLGSRRQRSSQRLRCVSVRSPARQPKQIASNGRQNVYAAQKVAHGRTNGGLVSFIQSVQKPLAQDTGSLLSRRSGNKVHEWCSF